MHNKPWNKLFYYHPLSNIVIRQKQKQIFLFQKTPLKTMLNLPSDAVSSVSEFDSLLVTD